jgi:hypothetical protein
MDPYLEAHWGDVHTSLMVYASNQINAQLPDDLLARVEESLAVGLEVRTWRTVCPDVRVVEEPGPAPAGASAARAAVAVAEPFLVLVEGDPRTQRHIKIIDRSDGGRVVTAIEVLSPVNKVGWSGRRAYRRKQREYRDARINLVEIDLIRGGRFILAVPKDEIPGECLKPYLFCVRRVAGYTQIELYRAPLREPLPNIPIPLRPSDRDVVLQLQPLIDDRYRDGRYHRTDYRAEPVPRLDEDDARWADELLRAKGLR